MLDSIIAKMYFNFSISKQEETKKTFDICMRHRSVMKHIMHHSWFPSLNYKQYTVYSNSLSNTLVCTSQKIPYTQKPNLTSPPPKKVSDKMSHQRKSRCFSPGIICAFNYIKLTPSNLKQLGKCPSKKLPKRYLQITPKNKGNV